MDFFNKETQINDVAILSSFLEGIVFFLV